MTTYEPKTLPLSQILLDPNNFRFQGDAAVRRVAETRFSEDGVQNAAFARLKADGLTELKQSIMSNGFVPVERIVVRKLSVQAGGVDAAQTEGDTVEPVAVPDLFVVLEGNRRLASLRWLKSDHEAGIDLPEQVLEIFDAVPVVVLESDDESAYLAIMGIRHVGGVKEWGGYQSAQLVHELRKEHSLSAQDVGSRLGLSAVEINRRYRAFEAMDQMRASEEYSDYVTSELYPLFHEALVSPKVRTWLSWDDGSMTFENEDERESFYSLLSPYTDTAGVKRPPKITSYSEIRELKTILDNEDAVQSLLDLEKPFSDASALVKSADAGRNWLSKINAALAALDHLGIREIRQLEDGQVKKLAELRDLIAEIVESREKQSS
ncbi:hypothetical protein [Microcella flavibacter]|uniref:hypothetical protein n=1 Tax=Microcella flavibacter TaxID=1804990 RepID=UPI0014569C86|nr:hypothetical protein [Microcella flavibacter]